MTQAVSYLRVSSWGAIDGDGFPRQREAVEKYASANGITIVEEFRDEGVRGVTELRDRNGLAACLAKCETDGIKIVLVEIADRLARDLVVSELIIREFQKLGVRVIAASGGVDLTAGDDTNPTGKLVRQILAAVAEFDKSVIVIKLRAARQRIRAKGEKCEGRKPYGHDPDRPDEIDILQKMTRLKIQGMTSEEIARSLNTSGQLSRYGREWHPITIGRILDRRLIAQ